MIKYFKKFDIPKVIPKDNSTIRLFLILSFKIIAFVIMKASIRPNKRNANPNEVSKTAVESTKGILSCSKKRTICLSKRKESASRIINNTKNNGQFNLFCAGAFLMSFFAILIKTFIYWDINLILYKNIFNSYPIKLNRLNNGIL
jgi:hypothetical protein